MTLHPEAQTQPESTDPPPTFADGGAPPAADPPPSATDVATSPPPAATDGATPPPTDVATPPPDTEATLETAAAELDAVETALVRLEDGTFDRCEVCGAPIDPTRLQENPLLTRCDQHPA